MDCPQCGAGVPSDDLFCGKCGYAMRDGGPERVDQSRIRMHEEPDPAAQSPKNQGSSQKRIRKHTVMGMPAATPPTGTRTPAPSEPPPPPSPPTEISTARSRAQKRTPQKTMLGLPRPDFPKPPPEPVSDAPGSSVSATQASDAPQSESPSRRARARVRYDSANEPFPVLEQRKKALRALALLVVLAGAWFAYRYLSLNG